MAGGPYLTAREAAAYVGKSYRGFDHWVRRTGVAFEWIGAHRRFTAINLDKAIQATSRRPSHLQRAS